MAYRRTGRGMGDATAVCPSFEQLLGVVDSTDPCQAGTVGNYNPGICYLASGGTEPCTVAGSTITGPASTVGPYTTAPAGAAASGTSTLLIGLAILVGVVVVGSIAGGSR